MFLQFIIPYYGSADLLINAVNSVLNQTDTDDIGLIVVDDNHFNEEGREQSTKAAIFLNNNRFGKVNIQYIKNDENLGVGKTRNVGLAAAVAKYVAFIDSDDTIAEDYISFIRPKLLKYRCNVLVGRYSYSKEVGEETHKYISDALTWLHGKVYNLSFLRRNNITFPPLRFNEDSGFNLMVYEMTHNIHNCSEDKVIYIWNQENMSSLTKLNKEELHSVYYYVQSINFAVKQILKKYGYNNTQRLPATLLQLYYYYCELLYKDIEISKEIKKEYKIFFKIIKSIEWYKLDKFKKSLAFGYFVHHKTDDMIPSLTLAQFIKKFEKEPLNFD